MEVDTSNKFAVVLTSPKVVAFIIPAARANTSKDIRVVLSFDDAVNLSCHLQVLVAPLLGYSLLAAGLVISENMAEEARKNAD